MNTKNSNSTSPDQEVLLHQQESTLVELKVLPLEHKKNFMNKAFSLQPKKIKPLNSMMGMRSLKPIKIKM